MKEKAAARFWGRQGGRFAQEAAGHLAAELHNVRLAELARGPRSDSNPGGGSWPIASLRAWDSIALAAVERDDAKLSAQEVLSLEIVETARIAGWRWVADAVPGGGRLT